VLNQNPLPPGFWGSSDSTSVGMVGLPCIMLPSPGDRSLVHAAIHNKLTAGVACGCSAAGAA